MTPLDRGLDCTTPVESTVLMDYWLGTLPESEEDLVEGHLMSCDACGDRMRQTIALAEGLRALARSGSLVVVVSDQFVSHAVTTGLRVRDYAPQPNESVQCTVSADDDLLVARLTAELSEAGRVDLSWCDAERTEFLRMTDIPVQADTGAVICQQSITFAKAAGSGTMIARLVTIGDEGERVLGEYTFNHTRTIPGPPG